MRYFGLLHSTVFSRLVMILEILYISIPTFLSHLFPPLSMDDTMNSPRKRTKVLSTLIIIGLIALVITIDLKRRAAEEQLAQLSVRIEQLTGNTQQNEEKAREIVELVRMHMNIQTDTEPTVAAIVDVAALRQRNAFYNKAENGDYLIVTADRAILYDPEDDRILDVVPVQIQPPAQQGQQPQAKAQQNLRPPASAQAVSSEAAPEDDSQE